jgi:hypothetical protein
MAWRFASNVFIGTTLVWVVLRQMGGLRPIWAIAAMIASTDPQMDVAARMFRSRIVNVLVGAAVGLVFMLVGGSSEWSLPFALAATVLISSYLVRIRRWRQAPIPQPWSSRRLSHQSKSAITLGLTKVVCIVRCAVGLVVSAGVAGWAAGQTAIVLDCSLALTRTPALERHTRALAHAAHGDQAAPARPGAAPDGGPSAVAKCQTGVCRSRVASLPGRDITSAAAAAGADRWLWVGAHDIIPEALMTVKSKLAFMLPPLATPAGA